jgi:DNA repair photolyase
MRWNNLLLDGGSPDESLTAPLFGQGAVVRRFDTPEFKGMTFYEVQAKSIINKVPEASRVPFRWTINPYRGCSHACFYCLGGETAILMADGQAKALAELRVGDAVYGTIQHELDRRYAVTEVLAHWSTAKAAYRVRLESGTEIIASGDHRFLTDRGWRFVAADEEGGESRSTLGPGDNLMGPELATGQQVRSPLEGVVESGTGLRVTSVEAMSAAIPMYDITTGTGDYFANGVVSHNCFARNTHTYLDLDAGQDFNSRIVVKVNAGDRLRAELARKSWKGEHIAMGTNVDPYQRSEGRYKLMPPILEAMRDFGNPFSILTKGSLILRDIGLLRECAGVADVGTNVSVGFVDRKLWRSLEPGTPSPEKRLEVCAKLNAAGIPCGVLMAPIIPFLSDGDEQLEATVKAVAESGATHISPIVLHLRTGAREWYLKWLEEQHPDLVPKYRALFPKSAYAPKAFQHEITAKVQALAQRYGIGRSAPSNTRRIAEGVARATGLMKAEQLSLL